MSFTKQETYDIGVRHMLTQAEQSLSEDACGCAYRGDRGLKCVVGDLIPGYMYQHRMEGQLADSRIVSHLLDRLGHDVDLCVTLQSVHDLGNLKDIGDWPKRLREVAAEFGLSSAIVDELEPSFREKLAASK